MLTDEQTQTIREPLRRVEAAQRTALFEDGAVERYVRAKCELDAAVRLLADELGRGASCCPS